MQLTLLPRQLPATPQKLRGGYYTPPALARYLTDWAIRPGDRRILEPSCGDGAFVEAILASRKKLSGRTACEVTAVEIDPVELAKTQLRAKPLLEKRTTARWVRDDFFMAYSELKLSGGFDAIVGNPPFIRFQLFSPESRDTAFAHLAASGYKPTKLANAWAGFVQLSIELLRVGGRLAMVVPAELLQVKYAEELRGRLTASFEQLTLIGFRRLVFPEIQQEVFLLLAEGKRSTPGIACTVHTLELQDGNELLRTQDTASMIAHLPEKHSHPGMKWTSLLLNPSNYEVLDRVHADLALPVLGHFADVDVGIVTGQNKFFVVDAQLRAQLGADRYTVPTVGRTSALGSIRFTRADFRDFSRTAPAFVLNLNGVPDSRIPRRLRNYLKQGEVAGVHLGYKCRIRRRWFDVPSISIPDGFLYRQISGFPLLVENRAGATSTDTIHRIRLRADVRFDQLAAASFNSLTLAWAEVSGRSYGGGVLELEPTEAEELPIPTFVDRELDSTYVDLALRDGNPTKALDYVDKTLLIDGLGISRKDATRIRAAWIELRDRRRLRK